MLAFIVKIASSLMYDVRMKLWRLTDIKAPWGKQQQQQKKTHLSQINSNLILSEWYTVLFSSSIYFKSKFKV